MAALENGIIIKQGVTIIVKQNYENGRTLVHKNSVQS